MRLVKIMLESKDREVMRAVSQHPWPYYGKPAIIFHDRGKIFWADSRLSGSGLRKLLQAAKEIVFCPVAPSEKPGLVNDLPDG